MTLANPSASATEGRLFWTLWLILLAGKLSLASWLPLSPDEAYYWVWSQNPQLSYYDHPGFVSWLFWLGDLFPGHGLFERWPAVILGHGLLVIWWKVFALLSWPFTAWLKWLAFLLLCPLTGLGSLVVTPDLPVLFFWSLAVYLSLKIISQSEASIWNWIGLGISLGLGFNSKYHIVLLVFSALLALFLRPLRKKILRPELGWTLFFGFLSCLPVILWNAQNDWISFRFQLDHGLAEGPWKPWWTVSYLLGEGILLFPVLIWFLFKHRESSPERLWLHLVTWVPLGFFFLTSFKASVELNWPIMAFPSFFALVATSPLPRWGLWTTISFWSVFHLFLVLALALPSRFHLHEKIAEPYRFRLLRELPRTYEPLYASNYQIASSLWYLSQTPVPKLRLSSRFDYFDFLEISLPKDDFYLLRTEDQSWPDWLIQENWVPEFVTSPAPRLEIWKVRKK